jgi:23S rRNA pseudouridine2605 synthase
MARSGHGSRRNIEILIAQGHISINGQVAKLGDQVAPGDRVLLDNRPLRLKFGGDLPKVLLYHKQEGEICTRDDPEGRPTVFDKLPRVHGGRWVAVGRLDFNTSGLLVFTTDGELANNLMHPRFEVEREYAVRLLGELTAEQHQQLVNGVTIEDELCKFEALEDRGGEGSNHWYHVILREGKNREVRKMFEAVGMAVSRLMRVRFGQIELPPRLKRGMMMELPEEEVENILSWAGVKKEEPEAAEPGNARAEGDEYDEFDEHLPNGNVIAPSPSPSAAAPGGQPRQGRPGGGKSRNRKRGRKPVPAQ